MVAEATPNYRATERKFLSAWFAAAAASRWKIADLWSWVRISSKPARLPKQPENSVIPSKEKSCHVGNLSTPRVNTHPSKSLNTLHQLESYPNSRMPSW